MLHALSELSINKLSSLYDITLSVATVYLVTLWQTS